MFKLDVQWSFPQIPRTDWPKLSEKEVKISRTTKQSCLQPCTSEDDRGLEKPTKKHRRKTKENSVLSSCLLFSFGFSWAKPGCGRGSRCTTIPPEALDQEIPAKSNPYMGRHDSPDLPWSWVAKKETPVKRRNPGMRFTFVFACLFVRKSPESQEQHKSCLASYLEGVWNSCLKHLALGDSKQRWHLSEIHVPAKKTNMFVWFPSELV